MFQKFHLTLLKNIRTSYKFHQVLLGIEEIGIFPSDKSPITVVVVASTLVLTRNA